MYNKGKLIFVWRRNNKNMNGGKIESRVRVKITSAAAALITSKLVAYNLKLVCYKEKKRLPRFVITFKE